MKNQYVSKIVTSTGLQMNRWCTSWDTLRSVIADSFGKKMYLFHQPCLSSTVHQVVGIGLGELVKIFSSSSGCSSSSNSSAPTNWWVGPGLVTASAAVKPALTKLSPGLSVTLWDKLEIQGDSSTTLQDFLHMMQQKYQLEVMQYLRSTARYSKALAGDHGGAGLSHGVCALHARP